MSYGDNLLSFFSYQVPPCSLSPDWASHMGSPTSWGLCWLLSILIHSLLLITDGCTLYWWQGPFIASSTKASEGCLETTRRGPSLAGHRGPLGCHQGEKTLSPGREVGTWPMHGFYAATKLYPTLKLRKPPSQLAMGYSDICPPCFFATGIFCPAAHHHSQKFKRVSLPLVKFKISKRKMPDVDN